jgi:hypothetical protein
MLLAGVLAIGTGLIEIKALGPNTPIIDNFQPWRNSRCIVCIAHVSTRSFSDDKDMWILGAVLSFVLISLIAIGIVVAWKATLWVLKDVREALR